MLRSELDRICLACGKPAIRPRLCAGHARRWYAEGKPDIEAWAEDLGRPWAIPDHAVPRTRDEFEHAFYAALLAGNDLPDGIQFVPPEWHQRAACRTEDPTLFFPGRGASNEHAKAVCASCPVSDECLDFALTSGEKFGIWGGTSERQRRRIRVQPSITAA